MRGLLYWLQSQLVPFGGRAQVLVPDEPTLRDALTFTVSQHRGATSGFARNAAGVWVVSELGLDRLQELIERAERERIRPIPPEWIEAELPESRNGLLEHPALIECCYRDAQGALVATKVGSLSTPWMDMLPAGAVSVDVHALAVPPYSGPRLSSPVVYIETDARP
jgi:hypothetical protein